MTVCATFAMAGRGRVMWPCTAVRRSICNQVEPGQLWRARSSPLLACALRPPTFSAVDAMVPRLSLWGASADFKGVLRDADWCAPGL